MHFLSVLAGVSGGVWGMKVVGVVFVGFGENGFIQDKWWNNKIRRFAVKHLCGGFLYEKKAAWRFIIFLGGPLVVSELYSAPKTILRKCWNIIENSKIPSQYHFSIDIFDKRNRTSHLQKVPNKNFSVISKHGVPCLRKYHLISFFWKKVFPISETL